MLGREAIYLLFTDIDSGKLIRALQCFGKIILYRLPEDQLEGLLSEAADRDLVEVVEINAFEDPTELKSILSDFNKWSEQFGDSGFLPFISSLGSESRHGDTSSRLASSIRGYDIAEKTDQDVLKEAQIFLHFAGQFDQQQREIDEIVADVDRREGLLGNLMGIEEPIDPKKSSKKDSEPGQKIDSDHDLSPKLLFSRLTAWSRFYSIQAAAATSLFTDQAGVVDLIDEAMARNRAGHGIGVKAKTEILEPFLEIRLPCLSNSASLNEIETWRQDTYGRFDSAFFKTLEMIRSQNWSRDEIAGLKHELDHMIKDASLESELEADEPYLFVNGYLLPGNDIKQAFLEAVGLSPTRSRMQDYCGPFFEIGTAVP
jgi:hypothetical protein